MKLLTLLAAAAAAMGSAAFSSPVALNHSTFRGPTPAARRKGLIDKSQLPRAYPGAKMARRAVQKGIGVKHHGLREDGITYKTVRV